MKRKLNPVEAYVALLFGALLLLSGCGTTGPQRAEETRSSMARVQQDIRQAEGQLEATAASLRELIRPDQPNPTDAYKKYAANVDQMETTAKRTLDHAERMREQRVEYFEEWRKQGGTYSNPEIRALSEQRRTELAAVMAKIPEAGVGARGAIQAYLDDIRDIRKFLANDLTPKGIETISPVAQRAVQDSEALKAVLRPWWRAIADAQAELARGGSQ